MKVFKNLLMYGLPFWLFLLLFFFYGYGKTDIATINKIAGLLAISLLGTSFVIGPLSFFLPNLFIPLRPYRKYLGIFGFAVALSHATISFIFVYNADLFFLLFDPANERLFAVYAGLTALFYFFFMTFISTAWAVKIVGGKWWKILQTGGYFAFAMAIVHFVLAEMQNGVFVVKRPLGRIVFVFAVIVVLLRMTVFLLKLFSTRR
ncbi:MAG: hypothetical protein HY429_04515 [Candidatus Levybacteria bacterium]|nr:hypothetical protein [Candidatus Levybacteria bacterium]